MTVLNVVFTAEAAGFAKPTPRIVQSACTKLALQQIRSLRVGDNLELDAISTSDAGLIERNLAQLPS